MSSVITNTIDLSSFNIFSKKPSISADSKIVLAAKNGSYSLIESEKQLSRGELISGKYATLYEVSVLPVTITHRKEYACSDLINRFDVDLTAKCYITNPIALVKNNETNIKDAVERTLGSVLKQLLSTYDIDEYSRLNGDNNLFENKTNLILEDLGLQLGKLSVTVKPYAEYLRVKQEIIEGNRKKELSKHNTELQQELDKDRYHTDINKLQLENEYNQHKKRYENENLSDKMNLIMTHIKEGTEELLPFVLKDDMDAYKMYLDLKEKGRSKKKEDLEYLLRLSKEYDYDFSELLVYQQAPEKIVDTYTASSNSSKAIAANASGYEPKKLTSDDEE